MPGSDKTILEIDEFKSKLANNEEIKDVAVRKQQNVEVKEVESEDRVLRFISSDKTRDRDGDTIEPKGWKLDNFNKNPVFLWAHDYSTPPLGKIISTKIEDGKKKQDVKFIDPKQMYPETEYKDLPNHVKFADMVFRMYKSGDMNAVSVGFDPIDYEYSDEKGGNIDFKEQEQLELSAVPVPSNPNALQVAGMKGVDNSIMQEWAKSVLKSVRKVRETPRMPVYEGKEKSDDISWGDIDKDLETFLAGYYENTENDEPEEMPTQVADITEDAKDWIANRTLLGEADAETVENLIYFPVVNPLTDNLHEGALRAVISGRGAQADIPDDVYSRAESTARDLLEEEFDMETQEESAEGETEKRYIQGSFEEQIKNEVIEYFNLDEEESWIWVEGILPDSFIVSVEEDDDKQATYYRFDYIITNDQITIDGDPEEVDLSTEIVPVEEQERSIEGIIEEVKQGAELSSKNTQLLQEARSNINNVLDGNEGKEVDSSEEDLLSKLVEDEEKDLDVDKEVIEEVVKEVITKKTGKIF